jgi:hypothetical protein
MEDMATCWKVDYFEGGNKDASGGEDTTRRRVQQQPTRYGKKLYTQFIFNMVQQTKH